ncbi:glutathione S-transferase family protein [Pseudidiomarina marina]|uniref:Glutathione S-transferase n=1 Tax=Pseudidiomarina marina TaxID=502366 RepID=A0A432YGB9_9GAMM|nr:glutathione S-transferase family protein [Pseudidiomarina marina]RUO59999.1 glutathione S-transferase [Pseudidiomarina marina]
MKLFGSYTSPYVRHCRIVLTQNNDKFEFIPTDYTQSAQQSPTQRVPFLHDGEVQLTDSASILRYLRERHQQPFCDDVADFDLFCLANTALDATVNLFLLERDNITTENSPYLQRQKDRVHSILTELDQRDWPQRETYSDGQLRLACFLSWAQFRERINVADYPRLQQFLLGMNHQPWFANTHPALS